MVSDLKLTDGGGVYRRRVQTRIESVIAVGAEPISLSDSAADDWSVVRLTSARLRLLLVKGTLASSKAPSKAHRSYPAA